MTLMKTGVYQSYWSDTASYYPVKECISLNFIGLKEDIIDLVNGNSLKGIDITRFNNEDADVVIARLSHTYGPGFTESDNRVYAQFIRNVLKGEDIVLKSKGEAFRSWLYVVDAAHAILRLLLDGERANVYNVAHSESNISIRQLAELIARKADRKVVFDIPEADAQQGNTTPITKATFSTDKLKALGWKPLFDVEEGFGHTLQEVREG